MTKEKLLLTCIFLLVIFLINGCIKKKEINSPDTQPKDNSQSGINSIYTSNYANQNLQYYYYIPKDEGNLYTKYSFLIMVPGLSGSGGQFVSEEFKELARKENFIIIAPTFIFDEENFTNNTSYQYPAAWSGEALNNIMKDFSIKNKIFPNGIYLVGFSAGAQFSLRYALLNPDKVVACAINGAGGIEKPKQYQKTKFYIAIGNNDADHRKKHAINFYNWAKQKNIDVTYKEYNAGHEFTTEEINDEIQFLTDAKNSLSK